MKYGDLHEKTLTFLNDDHQPRARYFYYRVILAMNRLCHAPPKTSVQTMGIPDDTIRELTRAWGSEGSYIRENVIRGFIEEMSHELPEDVERDVLSKASEGIVAGEGEKLTASVESMDLESDSERDS